MGLEGGPAFILNTPVLLMQMWGCPLGCRLSLATPSCIVILLFLLIPSQPNHPLTHTDAKTQVSLTDPSVFNWLSSYFYSILQIENFSERIYILFSFPLVQLKCIVKDYTSLYLISIFIENIAVFYCISWAGN